MGDQRPLSTWFFTLVAFSVALLFVGIGGFVWKPSWHDDSEIPPLKITEEMSVAIPARSTALEKTRSHYLLLMHKQLQAWSPTVKFTHQSNEFDARMTEHKFVIDDRGAMTECLVHGSFIDHLGIPNSGVAYYLDITTKHGWFSLDGKRRQAEQAIAGLNAILMQWDLEVRQILLRTPE